MTHPANGGDTRGIMYNEDVRQAAHGSQGPPPPGGPFPPPPAGPGSPIPGASQGPTPPGGPPPPRVGKVPPSWSGAVSRSTGAPVTPTKQPGSGKDEDKVKIPTWLGILGLIVCFPLGIALIFGTNWKLRTKMIAAGVSALLSVGLVAGGAAGAMVKKDAPTAAHHIAPIQIKQDPKPTPTPNTQAAAPASPPTPAATPKPTPTPTPTTTPTPSGSATPPTIQVFVSGSQTYGSAMAAFAGATTPTLPSGVTLSGTATCSRVSNGASINASLAAGSYAIDASSCSGLSLTGTSASSYTLSLAAGTFTVAKADYQVTVMGNQTYGSSSPTFTATTAPALPSGVQLGSFYCTKANGTTIGASLAAASYTLDATSCSALSLVGINPANYTLNPVNGTFTVSPEPLQVQVNGNWSGRSDSAPSFYGQQLWTSPSNIGVTGTPTCATVTWSVATDTFTVDASSCTGLSLTGANSNYTMVLVNGTLGGD